MGEQIMEQTVYHTKTAPTKGERIGAWAGAALILLTAFAVAFGLHPHYRLIGVGIAAFAVVPLIWKRTWWWTCSLVLLGLVVLLWAFGPAGYRYTSLLPLMAILLVLVFRFAGRGVKIGASVLAALGLVALLLVEAPIIAAANRENETEADYVIVLGAAVYGETPSISLRSRMDRAVEYLAAHPSAKVVASGGQGEGEDISEAECMRRYFLRNGIDESRILLEAHSTSTMENLTFSRTVIENDGGSAEHVAVVSSGYHLYRAKAMAASLGMQAVGLAGADGYPLYMTGMYIREALGVVKLWLFGTWEREACLSSVYAIAAR